MLINGEWSPEGSGQTLKLGEVFLGRVYPKGDPALSSWTAVLNGVQLSSNTKLSEAKHKVEWEIICRLRFIAPAYRVMVARTAR